MMCACVFVCVCIIRSYMIASGNKAINSYIIQIYQLCFS